jgi:hypothetical protein
MFVSGEGFGGRLDCGAEGVQTAVSQERLRGIRIFDITNVEEPEYVANVQTCRGSHTHSVLKDPEDDENVLRADHNLNFYGFRFLNLHYKMTKKPKY